MLPKIVSISSMSSPSPSNVSSRVLSTSLASFPKNIRGSYPAARVIPTVASSSTV